MKKYLVFPFLLFLGFSSAGFSNTDSLIIVLDQMEMGEDTAKLEILNDLIKNTLWNYPDQALQFAETYDSIAQNTKIQKYLGKGKNFRGMCYHAKGDTEQAMKYYLDAIQFFEAAKDSLFIGILYNNIGACSVYRGKVAETVDYYHKALGYFEAIKNEMWINNINVNLGVQYINLEEYEKSNAFHKKALNYYQNNKDFHHQGLVMANMGSNYLFLEEFKKSLEFSIKGLGLIDPNMDMPLVAMANINIGNAYIQLKKPHQAKPYLDKALSLSREFKSLEREIGATKAMTNYFAAVGQFKEGLSMHEVHLALKDSLFNEEKDKAMVEATTRFETNKKQQKIDLLNAQNEVQKIKLNQSRRQSLFYITGILGLGLLALVLFYAFQTKKKSLAEKELLLREIHHRVKNNLQVVTSLLNIQQRRIKDPEAITAIQESKNRVESMALIHQSLYQNNDLSNINSHDYIHQLVEYIFKTYSIDKNKINYNIKVEPIKMDMDTLIPLGLILNELINNAIKHAFSEKEGGTISIVMNEQKKKIMLQVSDNGIGMPDEQKLRSSNSFGFKMIQAFVKKLNATLNILYEKGTTLQIAFERPK